MIEQQWVITLEQPPEPDSLRRGVDAAGPVR